MSLEPKRRGFQPCRGLAKMEGKPTLVTQCYKNCCFWGIHQSHHDVRYKVNSYLHYAVTTIFGWSPVTSMIKSCVLKPDVHN